MVKTKNMKYQDNYKVVLRYFQQVDKFSVAFWLNSQCKTLYCLQHKNLKSTNLVSQ